MSGRTAAGRTRYPSLACRRGCLSDSPHLIPDDPSNLEHLTVAMRRRHWLRKNNSSSIRQPASETPESTSLRFGSARFIAIEALAHGDVEAVLFDVAARLGIPQHEARATIASGLRAGTGRGPAAHERNGSN